MGCGAQSEFGGGVRQQGLTLNQMMTGSRGMDESQTIMRQRGEKCCLFLQLLED